MSEHFPNKKDTLKVTSLDHEDETPPPTDAALDLPTDVSPPSPEFKSGDIIERDGKEYILVPELRWAERWEDGRKISYQVPYTYRQYYAHTYEEPATGHRIPGPGWDAKFRLYDDNIAMLLHNRTFTKDELEDFPANLPNADCLFVSDPDGGRAMEYKEYLEKSSAS